MISRKLFLTKARKHPLSKAERTGDAHSITTELFDTGTAINVRKIKYPRASSIYSCCVRMHVIATTMGVEKTERTFFNRRLTFDIGNAVHFWLQNDPSYLGDQRRGQWKCLSCGRVSLFGKPIVTKCPSCGASPSAYVYNELELVMDTPYTVSGHPDMFVAPKSNKDVIRVMEFKTINGEKFETLKAPMISHIWQLQTYVWMLNENDALLPASVDPDYGYIVYISKKEKYGELPIKTFVVKKDRTIISKVKKKLSTYMDGVAGKGMPPVLSNCQRSNFTDYIAKSCPVADVCKNIKMVADNSA